MTEPNEHKQQRAERIERYILGEMTPSEVEVFEQEMSMDKDLAQEVKLHRFIHGNVLSQPEVDFKNKLSTAASNWAANQKPKTRWMQRLMTVAAGIALFAAAWFFFTNRTSDQQLAFVPYEMMLNQRAAADTTMQAKNLRMAITSYEDRNYSEAQQYFSALKSDETVYSFYQGVAALGAEDFDTAKRVFQDILSKSDPLFEEQARFYLALTYGLSGDADKSEQLFNQIKPGEYNPLRNQ